MRLLDGRSCQHSLLLQAVGDTLEHASLQPDADAQSLHCTSHTNPQPSRVFSFSLKQTPSQWSRSAASPLCRTHARLPLAGFLSLSRKHKPPAFRQLSPSSTHTALISPSSSKAQRQHSVSPLPQLQPQSRPLPLLPLFGRQVRVPLLHWGIAQWAIAQWAIAQPVWLRSAGPRLLVSALTTQDTPVPAPPVSAPPQPHTTPSGVSASAASLASAALAATTLAAAALAALALPPSLPARCLSLRDWFLPSRDLPACVAFLPPVVLPLRDLAACVKFLRLRLASRRAVAPLPPPTPRKARFETHQGQVGHVAQRADRQLHADPRRTLVQGQNQSPFLSRGPDCL
jgi:hypothetical protein